MKELPVGKDGLVALVDEEDYPLLSRHKWYVFYSSDRPYAATWFRDSNISLQMSHLVFPAHREDGHNLLVDHINGNSLDNRKSNLRYTTRSGNARNARAITGSSKYKGVAYHQRLKKWAVGIWLNGKRKHIGYCVTQEEAALIYDATALQHFGEHAWLNIRHFPELWKV